MTIALTQVPGIGPSTAKVLAENGINSAQQLADTTLAQLTKVPGFGSARASRAIKAAIESLASTDDATTKTDQPTQRPRRTAKKPASRLTRSSSVPATGAKATTGPKQSEAKELAEKKA